MEETKEETRIIITHDSKNGSASTYLSNSNIDIEAHIIMFCSHVNLVIKNLMLGGMQFCEAVATVQNAMTIATDRIIGELAEENK